MSDLDKYQDANWEELIELDDFRAWALGTDTDDTGAAAAWATTLAGHPERRLEAERAKAFLATFAAVTELRAPTEAERAEDRHRITAKIENRRHAARRKKYLVAGLGVIVLLVSLAGYLWYSPKTFASTVYATTSGEIRRLTLPDGSTVTLNANTTLSHATDWGANGRYVRLDGEAFFDVATQRNAAGGDARFTVATEDLDVRVVGTRFNVNAYFNGTEIVLNEGRVDLLTAGGGPILTPALSPGERFLYDSEDASRERNAVDTLAYSGWKDGYYVFDDTPLGDIVDRLAVIYGVDFYFTSEALRSVRVSTTASVENLDEFLRVLNLLFDGDGIEAVRRGDRITVRRRE